MREIATLGFMLSLILASSLALAPQAFQQHCFDCHGAGASTGGLALDEIFVDRMVDDATTSRVDDRTRQLAEEAMKLELRLDGVEVATMTTICSAIMNADASVTRR